MRHTKLTRNGGRHLLSTVIQDFAISFSQTSATSTQLRANSSCPRVHGAPKTTRHRSSPTSARTRLAISITESIYIRQCGNPQ